MKIILIKIIHKLAHMCPGRRIRFEMLHAIHLRLEDCEPELRHLADILPEQRRCALDIGANVGHYSLELSKYFSNVIAFEINSDLTSDLSRSRDNITVNNCGLSSKSGDATLYIPLLNGTFPLLGWASLSPGNCPDTDVHQEKKVMINTLDSFNLKNIDFIKIDVEGHELEVLKGGIRTLQSCSPVLLIEIKEDNYSDVREFLEDIGYAIVEKPSCCDNLDSENFIFRATQN